MFDPSWNSAMQTIGEEQIRNAVANMTLGERLLRAYRQNDDVLFDSALHEVEKLNALIPKLRTFANEHVCPVNENCLPGFVAGAYSAWGWARSHISTLLGDL